MKLDKELKEKVGTTQYQSPEQLLGKSYNEKVDIFAIGLILLELCLYFTTNHEKQVTFQQIHQKTFNFKSLGDEFSNEQKLIEKMTQTDASLRPSANEILNSEDYKALSRTYKSNDA